MLPSHAPLAALWGQPYIHKSSAKFEISALVYNSIATCCMFAKAAKQQQNKKNNNSNNNRHK